MSDLLTFRETAQEIGTDINTVAGIVKLLGISPKPVPRNGNAKGLDRLDISRIRRAIKAGRRQPAHASS